MLGIGTTMGIGMWGIGSRKTVERRTVGSFDPPRGSFDPLRGSFDPLRESFDPRKKLGIGAQQVATDGLGIGHQEMHQELLEGGTDVVAAGIDHPSEALGVHPGRLLPGLEGGIDQGR